MDGEPRYIVVVVHGDGVRDVRASNVPLERAQAVQATIAPIFPHARVVIEPQSAVDTWRPGGDTWEGPPVEGR